jgi:putative glutamine amidotransferase
MPIRIAIPEPTSTDLEYNARSLPPYLAALQSSGATPIIIPLHAAQDTVAKLLANTQGVLLPGSGFDVDPERFGEPRIPECGPADPARTAVDELLLQDAFNLRKPVLAICHGLQTMNVWLSGSLIQDIPAVLRTPVNHSPGRDIVDAHPIAIQEGSILAQLAVRNGGGTSEQVNSSHHQAIARLGDRLIVSALSPQDGVVEAVEGHPSDHFVLGVQWHPERTFVAKQFSRDIFGSVVRAAEAWQPSYSSS